MNHGGVSLVGEGVYLRLDDCEGVAFFFQQYNVPCHKTKKVFFLNHLQLLILSRKELSIVLPLFKNHP